MKCVRITSTAMNSSHFQHDSFTQVYDVCKQINAAQNVNTDFQMFSGENFYVWTKCDNCQVSQVAAWVKLFVHENVRGYFGGLQNIITCMQCMHGSKLIVEKYIRELQVITTFIYLTVCRFVYLCSIFCVALWFTSLDCHWACYGLNWTEC